MARKRINRTHRRSTAAVLGVNLNAAAAQTDRRGSERLMGGGWYNRWRPICGHRELAWIRLLECVNCSNKTAQLIHAVMPPPPNEMVQNITIIFSSYMRVKVHSPPPPSQADPPYRRSYRSYDSEENNVNFWNIFQLRGNLWQGGGRTVGGDWRPDWLSISACLKYERRHQVTFYQISWEELMSHPLPNA